MDFGILFGWVLTFWLLVVSPVAIVYCFFIYKPARPKPDNYVGKFLRPDGQVVHVARMPSGDLWTCTEEEPGVEPVPLGYVSGLEVTRWHKLGTSPDGG